MSRSASEGVGMGQSSFRCGALVLAAGFARRFGGSKLAEPLADGRQMIEHTLERIGAALDEIVIVARAESVREWRLVRNHPRLKLRSARESRGTGRADDDSPRSEVPIYPFENAQQGMGASLAWGIARLPPWDGCLVCLADMPFIEPRTYRMLAERLTAESIVVPCHEGRRGNPVGFGRRFFPQLAGLRDEAGGRQVIREHADSRIDVAVADRAVLLDIDTPADLLRCNGQPRKKPQYHSPLEGV